MFMSWHVLINSKYFASAPYLSNYTDANFLSWFLNSVIINLRMSIGERLLLDGNPKGCEVAKHMATKVEVNPRMFSTLKKAKSIWSMEPGANSETSLVGPMGVLAALVKRKIWQGFSKSEIISGRPSICTFLDFRFSLVTETLPKRRWINWEIFCFESAQTVGEKYPCLCEGLLWQIYIWR